MKRYEVIVGGSGGQGVLLLGEILGKAAVLEGKNVCHTRSYGAEARGGMVRSEIVISDEEIDYPMVIEADTLLAMSQSAMDRCLVRVKSCGDVIIDEDVVRDVQRKDVRIIKTSALRTASETMHMPLAANMILLGVLLATTNFFKQSSLGQSIEMTSPHSMLAINLEALNIGVKYAQSLARNENIGGQ